jgi:hypothetical protein
MRLAWRVVRYDAFLTRCIHHLVNFANADSGDWRAVALAGICPSRGTLLGVGVDDDNLFPAFLCGDSRMHGKRGFTAAPFLAEENK